jgi:hypothetical protein
MPPVIWDTSAVKANYSCLYMWLFSQEGCTSFDMAIKSGDTVNTKHLFDIGGEELLRLRNKVSRQRPFCLLACFCTNCICIHKGGTLVFWRVIKEVRIRMVICYGALWFWSVVKKQLWLTIRAGRLDMPPYRLQQQQLRDGQVYSRNRRAWSFEADR